MLDAAPGIGALAQAPLAPIAMPIIVPPIVVPPVVVPPLVAPPGLGMGGGPGGPAGPRGPSPNSGPREMNADPRTGRQPEAPFRGGDPGVPPATFRVGYVEYLRTAGISQIAAVAVPGVAGILLLTGAGGLVGYRQAKAGRAVRGAGTARFIE
ncbi:hypothetical protein O6P37_20920 [Mycobacterium sp. CPCC 205372]|uniref:Uncharacterized protein n=2 Tax=Mycobacteriaceae TaxID=1762 RepID=A0A9X2YCK8_9MYCO|nr:hypothetical protein [Mycobacterium hippophais]MCV7172102.1 hypothetical protein [[Mycobacterium] manitobense]MCZ8381336.1 hypothetical protein [Mycobacterium hippophais]